MNFGDKIKIEMIEIVDGVKIIVKNFPAGISITALDFGKDLAKRKMEGYSPDAEEEIDVLSGIENECTDGKDIIFQYIKGNYQSGIILVGTLVKKLLHRSLEGRAIEIGGISLGEKNEAYVRVAIQKMIMTNDSFGSVVEVDLPYDTNLELFKPKFSSIAFQLIPEIEAIQFGLGLLVGKKCASNIGEIPKKIVVTLGPDMNRKIPALGAVYDIVLESLAAITLINI
ncbi:hypothetical protein [Cetobacterium sp. SF1]|uniref:hypothetical protein n=1 Tax=Cetobacterium sp. SF1 TaxID=3417654 RepID=UPI003CE9B940